MSATLSGRVVGDGGAGVSGLQVVIRDETALCPSDLQTTTTDGSGNYSATVPDDPLSQDGLGSVRKVGVHIYPPKGPRQLSYVSYDVTGSTVQATDVTLRAADVSGWAVSLPGTTNALPVRKGNAVRLLVDDKLAWEHVAAAMSSAQKAISVMQLEMDIPRKFNATQSQERPEIILSFPDTYDTLHPTSLDGTTPNRPERMLLDAASAGKQVRVMIPHPDLGFVAVADFVILLVPMLVGALFAFRPAWTFWEGIFGHILGGGPKGDADALKKYFKDASSSATVVNFTTRTFSVVHAKAVLVDAVVDAVDNAEAMLLGSPFSPSYWDTLNHLVYEPRRADCAGEPIPVHDVSIGIRGPAVADVQQQFLLHWNRDCVPADKVSALDPAPAVVSAGSGEYAATVQIARTVNESTLPGLDPGEEGVLEVADRLRVPVVRSEAGDLFEREPRAGADEQPVVGELLAGGRRHGVRSRVDLLGRLVDEPDPLAGVDRRERERHVLRLAAAERQPDQRRDEREVRARIEHHDLVTITHLLLQLEGRGQPREARSDDHDTLALRTGHESLLALRRHAFVGLQSGGRRAAL